MACPMELSLARALDNDHAVRDRALRSLKNANISLLKTGISSACIPDIVLNRVIARQLSAPCEAGRDKKPRSVANYGDGCSASVYLTNKFLSSLLDP